jgi:hypothetical protein
MLSLVPVLALALAAPQGAPVKVEIPGTKLAFELAPVAGGTSGGRELQPFHLGVKELSWAEFNAYFEGKDEGVDATTRPTKAIAYFGQVGVPADFLEARRPVTNLRWHSMIGYCDWLSKKTGWYLRPPTELEWEFAARAGGVEAGSDDTAWHQGNSGNRTHESGEKKPNVLGIHDLYGNVWEYVLEFKDGSAFDPLLKGGCWSTPAAAMKASARQGVPLSWFEEDPNRPRSVWWLTNKDQSQGFRLAGAADPSDLAARKEAAGKVSVKTGGFSEKVVKIETAQTFFIELEGEITNGSGTTLDEVEVEVYYLDPKGKPHRSDIAGTNKPGQATFTKAWPVLRNSALGGGPLKPGETRAFKAEIPQSFDGDDDVDHEKFGGRVTNVRIAK